MKKVISIMISLVIILGAFAITASAAEDVTPAGFYNIGTNGNMEVTALSGDAAAEEVAVDLDGDGENETLYANSDVLNVVCSQATEGAYYGVILVEGSGLPTVDNEIYYIDQKTAEGDSVAFAVIPKLPAERTDLTLYVSSSVKDSALQSVALAYTTEGTPDEPDTPDTPEYTLGDIDGVPGIAIEDAVMSLQFVAELKTPTAAEKLAADVNASTTVTIEDSVMILQYIAGLRSDWN